ncbi:hypothetical protein LCGC14_2616150, partial [marine sediment metagenome]
MISMRLAEFHIKDDSTDAIMDGSEEHFPLRFFFDRDATAKLTNTGGNKNNFVYGMFAQIDDDGTYDTTSTGRIQVDHRAFYVSMIGSPNLSNSIGTAAAGDYHQNAFRASISGTATVVSG